MKAAMCLELDQPLSVEEVTPLDPGPDDVIVHITASGVCHSDLSVINGTPPAPARSCSATRAPAWSRRSAPT